MRKGGRDKGWSCMLNRAERDTPVSHLASIFHGRALSFRRRPHGVNGWVEKDEKIKTNPNKKLGR